MESGFEIRKRRPFSKLAEPAGDNRNALRGLTAKAIRYNKDFNYGYFDGDLLRCVQKELNVRALGGQVCFLDAGAGRGMGILLAELISPNVVAHGLALHDSDSRLGIPAHKWTKGHFEVNVFQKTGSAEGAFDVIQSRYGLQHAANQAMALENLLNSLKVGGKLFNFHDRDRNTAQLADTGMTEALEQQGFVLQKSRVPAFLKKIYNRILVNSPTLYVITRTSGQKADLSAFYGSARINAVPLGRTAVN